MTNEDFVGFGQPVEPENLMDEDIMEDYCNFCEHKTSDNKCSVGNAPHMGQGCIDNEDDEMPLFKERLVTLKKYKVYGRIEVDWVKTVYVREDEDESDAMEKCEDAIGVTEYRGGDIKIENVDEVSADGNQVEPCGADEKGEEQFGASEVDDALDANDR